MVFTVFLDRVFKWVSRRAVYHGIFWVVFFLILMAAGYATDHTFGFVFGNEILSLFFYVLVVYFNLLYLIPNYLLKNKILSYLGLLLVACLVVTPLKTSAFYLRFSEYPDFREQLVDNQGLIFLGNLLVAALSTMLSIITGWWRFQQQTQQIVTRNMQDELRFLRNQINPHFLFNTLNNLFSLTLQKSDRAPDIVLKLSEIMRYMLYECNDRQVLLSKEIQYMENYLDLERLRQPDTVDISLKVEGHVSDQMIAPLLFIPFLENAFKHGVQNQITAGGFVRAHLRVQDQDLEFFIENSKPTHSPRTDVTRRSGGIGLQNVQQRLQLLYPGHYDISVENTPNRYAVTLLLDLQD